MKFSAYLGNRLYTQRYNDITQELNTQKYANATGSPIHKCIFKSFDCILFHNWNFNIFACINFGVYLHWPAPLERKQCSKVKLKYCNIRSHSSYLPLPLHLSLSMFLCKPYFSVPWYFVVSTLILPQFFSGDYLSLLLKFGLTTVKDRNEIEKNCGFISSCGFILHECMWYFW